MITFSIKVDDALLEQLQRRLSATGQSRSAFVRGLIERELGVDQIERDAARARLLAFAGICGRDSEDRTPTDVAGNVKKYLAEWGYGLDRSRRG